MRQNNRLNAKAALRRILLTNRRIFREETMGEVKDLYEKIMPTGGFVFDENLSNTAEGQYCYTLLRDKGEGYFWNYFYKDMFVIDKQDFRFFDDFFLETPEPDFIAVQYYFSVSGEELHPYRQLSPNSLRCYAGGGKTFQAIYHKEVPIRSVGVSVMPDFYNSYLKEKLGGEYIDPRNAFEGMTSGLDFPQLAALLKQLQTYSGSGISAKLFYEGKVLEIIALILEQAKKNSGRRRTSISKADEENLKAAADYINHHFGFPVSSEQLCRIAYMGNTTLRTKFKEYFGCSITDYIIQKRIDQAQHLLIGTELSIAEIAQAVGYNRPESFAKQFKRLTGLLPREYRKIIEQK